MFRFVSVILFIIFTHLCAREDMIPECSSSGPELIAQEINQAFLVDNIVSPVSGQLNIHQTDLIARGAQNLTVRRYYIPPFVPCSFHNDPQKDELSLYTYLNRRYRGWVVFPHLYLKVKLGQKMVVHLREPNGLIIDFILDPITNLSSLKNPDLGFCNYIGKEPSGKNDIRNTRIESSADQSWMIVFTPHGTKRYYEKIQKYHSLLNYVLRKEILPNGKIIRYQYTDEFMLSHIESLDPKEQVVYSTIHLEREDKSECFISHLGNIAKYAYDKSRLKYQKKEQGIRAKIHLDSPSFLLSCSSPFYADEKINYNPKFLLTSFKGKNENFHCTYGCFGNHFRIEQLLLPSGSYSFSYDPVVPREKSGITEVVEPDGSKKIYHISEDYLLTKIQFITSTGEIHKEILYDWNKQNYLNLVEIRDKDSLILSKSYVYDDFGNPIEEIISGNLTGEGDLGSYSIKREFSQDGFNLLLHEEKENGLVTEYQYLKGTNLLSAKFYKSGNQILKREFHQYDDCNNLIQTTLDNGSSTECKITDFILRESPPFMHMSEWIVEKYIEDGQERILQKKYQHYDKNGFVNHEDIYDANGQFRYSIHKEYNQRGNLVSETNPLQQNASYQYNKRGRCKSGTEFSNYRSFNKKYDKRGLIKYHEIIGKEQTHSTSFFYDRKDRLVEKRDHLGFVTSYAYDSFSKNPIEIHYPSIRSIDGSLTFVKTSSHYDALNRLLQHTDENGHTTTYQYNAYGSPVRIVHPNGGLESFTYYPSGLCKTYTDADGLHVRYTYDVFDRPLSKTYFSSSGEKIAIESFTYDAFHLLSETDKEGFKTTYTYDCAGRRIKEQRENQIIEYAYDALGRLKRIRQPNGNNTLLIHYERDLLDRIIKEWHTDEKDNLFYQVEYEYDADGNQSIITHWIHSEARKSHYIYDSFHRLKQFQDALGNKTQFVYVEEAEKGLSVHKTDPLGIFTVKSFDAFDRLSEKTIFDSNGTAIAKDKSYYDPAGNLLQHHTDVYDGTTKLRTSITDYRYYPDNQLSTMTRAFGTSNERTTNFTYTSGGKLAQKILPDQTTLYYSYNPLGYIQSLESSNNQIHHTFSYNRLGYLKEAQDYKQQIHIKRNLDPFGNILEESFNDDLSLQKTYDDFNRPLSLILPDGSTIQYSYDAKYPKQVSRLGKIRYQHQYTNYDHSGHLTEESLVGDLGLVTYNYDAKGNLQSLQCPYLQEEYRYDPLDNLVQTTSPDEAFYYIYDNFSQLTSERKGIYRFDSKSNLLLKNQEEAKINDLDEITVLGSTSCIYDLNGNLIKKSNTCFQYDSLNRLIAVESNEVKVDYLYDPLGRRIKKTITKPHSIHEERYLYDGEEEIAAFIDKKLTQLKVLSPDKKPIAIELNGNPYAVILDQGQNVRHLIDFTTQEPYLSYNYSAFGASVSTRKLSNPWQYKAKRFDAELALYYFGKRYYDPELLRWLTLDPAEACENLYAYVHNNPFKYLDPDGQFAFLIAIPLIGVEAGAAATLAWSAAATAVAWGGYELSKFLNKRMDEYQARRELEQQNDQTSTIDTEEEKKVKEPPYNGKLLGDDPTKCPGEGFEWKGKGEVGSKEGSWHNEEKDVSLHPDFDHPPPKKPHWDYEGAEWPWEARLNLDGTWEPK